jgi:hypothetical protein
VTVQDGFVLDASITGVGNNTGLSRSFIGVQSGSVMTVPPTATSATGLLGWTHYGTADGINLLPALDTGIGATGFTGPLAAGAYTFWFNEVSSDAGLAFDMNFHTTPAPVPLPAALPPLLSGLAGFGLMGRRRTAITA